jgi:hypothetical protein
MIHSASLLSPTAEVTLSFENIRVIRRGLQLLHSLDLTPRDFYLCASFKDKVYKTNPSTLEELRNNIRPGISTISEQEHRTVNVIRSCHECIRSGGQHSQHVL